MLERLFIGSRFRLPQFRDDTLGQDLAKFHAPLIESVDLPDRALGEDAVLVKRNQFAQRRSIALERAVRRQPLRCPGGPDFLGRPAECARLSLREHIGQQQIVMLAQRIERMDETDEVARNELRSLVDELIKRCWPLVHVSPQ
jgi:hypothetical protein